MSSGRARIIQLSDLHLTSRYGRKAWRTDTWTNFRRTLAWLDHFEPFDRLVLTGDLANFPSRTTYRLLRAALEPWIDRVRVLPGNHDGRGMLRAAFVDRFDDGRATFVDELGGFRLLGLDSKRSPFVHGRIGDAQLDAVRATLSARAMPTLMFLHHPLVPVGTWWLDKDVVRDAGALLEAARAGGVQAAFHGHVHQEFAGESHDVALHACPSTAYQFVPGSARPAAVEARDPALRVIELDGEAFTTRVERLASA